MTNWLLFVCIIVFFVDIWTSRKLRGEIADLNRTLDQHMLQHRSVVDDDGPVITVEWGES